MKPREGEKWKCGDCEAKEGREAKGATAPQTVSKKEREEHERTHTPYRSWRDYFVRARGMNRSHKKTKKSEEEKEE